MSYQRRVEAFMLACFGFSVDPDTKRRSYRFLEEALELVQTQGCTAGDAHTLVEYVYGRPIGDPHQEVGGVMVTLAALCTAGGLDLDQAALDELARVHTRMDAIREKQKYKPNGSPLPRVVDVLCRWTLRKGTRDVYECPDCKSWTANLPLYKDDVCPTKDRRKATTDRRAPA